MDEKLQHLTLEGELSVEKQVESFTMADNVVDSANPAQPILAQDSATTKAENIQSNGAVTEEGNVIEPLSPRKRPVPFNEEDGAPAPLKRQKGVVPIKAE